LGSQNSVLARLKQRRPLAAVTTRALIRQEVEDQFGIAVVH
jgi:hypothetical protein